MECFKYLPNQFILAGSLSFKIMKQLFFLLLLVTSIGHAQNSHSFNVYFNLDNYALTPEAAVKLDSFLTAAKSTATVKLSGHCDIAASFTYNDALSIKRVNAVKDYLLSKGFKADNITSQYGYGKRKLINSNAGEQERQLNRRVEIVVTDDVSGSITSKEQFLPQKTLTEQIKDTQSIGGKNIVLRNLNFYGGTHRVLPESAPVLLELLDVMKKNPSLQIAIEGHVCCKEGPGDGLDIETNTQNLSENRAKEIYSYLLKNGIPASRLKYQGFGHRFPLLPGVETTEEERTANRRVEIQILKR